MVLLMLSSRLVSVQHSARLLISWYESLFIMQMMMVVSSSYFTVKTSWCLGVQSWVYSVNRRRLSTQPWGAPVLSTILTANHNFCGLLVRKSNIQLQSVEFKSTVFSFQISFMVRLCWTLIWSQQTTSWCSCSYSPGVWGHSEEQ